MCMRKGTPLTKEYFEKVLDKKLKPLATKEEMTKSIDDLAIATLK